MGTAPTLTIEEGTFVFMRDTDSERRGDWFPTETSGRNPSHVAVAGEFGRDLTALAMARGISEAFNFALHPPEQKKKPREKVERSPVPSVVKGGFNPFKAKETPAPTVGVAPPEKKRDLEGRVIKAGSVVKAGKK